MYPFLNRNKLYIINVYPFIYKISNFTNSFQINDRKIKLFNDWEMSDNYIITTSRRWGVCFSFCVVCDAKQKQ